ncbi:membrane-associated tyrosine- and threonine-specific cdc2-inhibitory kinase isoform X2 [Teleopsis dalmanni]|uniref:membrane-associated tyrosine- and threonine-specific cdc2-inhibitory kinase isoform X2 n=1 Tax=Teleopsis dalmanni TaxID=139649 RepID=UPI0018CF78AF|nr:membrane-associated tyrosine- and threonine-specific cdc2-inhibitory kinase isoform X2 [Teleopsis dalmanni]
MQTDTMIDITNGSFNLPIPDIREDVLFQHSHKQARRDDTNRLRPPKLNKRYYHDNNFNRSHSSSPAAAFAISFRGSADNISEAETVPLNSSMDASKNQTYFEQSFTCISKIGEGSFGEVFKVKSKEDGCMYAVKMSKQMFRSETYRQERLEEVRRYEQFSGHANCLRFYRAWEQCDRLYMQMELCQESLEHYLERKKEIPEEKIWSILLDLLLALKSLHDRNLIHLDIKLDNVLIGDDDSCKLADFGLVIDVDKANRHEATEGDSRYMAPEIMQGVFSKAADIFSLGVTMLELSCNLELPSNGQLWQQLRKGLLPESFIKDISLDLQQIIKQMMTPDHETRPTVDALLTHEKLRRLKVQRDRWEFLRQSKQSIRNGINNSMNDQNARHTEKEVEEHHNIPIICTHVTSSTPTVSKIPTPGFLCDDNSMDFCQSYTPSHFANGKVINSTPVNLNCSALRPRKELEKTVFRTLQFKEPLPEDQSNKLSSLDDIETRCLSLVRQRLELSSLRGKLFSEDESD